MNRYMSLVEEGKLKNKHQSKEFDRLELSIVSTVMTVYVPR